MSETHTSKALIKGLIKTLRLYERREVKPKIDESGSWLTGFQVAVGIVISLATAFISWQTHQLNQQTQESTERLKAIEQQLAETRFGFERMRDIYDRTEKYLAAPASAQDPSRGRVLAVLINSIPDTSIRAELLAVITKESKSAPVAAAAATLSVTGKLRPATTTTIIPRSLPAPSSTTSSTPHFSGNLAVSVNEERYTATTIGDFEFIDSKGVIWRVPKGTIADASSVPRAYWSIVGPPLTSDYTIPTILLDYFTREQKHPPEQVHKMFWDALLATGMETAKAKMFYTSVSTFGPRWTVKQ